MTLEWMIRAGALAGSITAMLALVMWVYNKLVTEPNCKLAADIQVEASRQLSESLMPLINSIDRLSSLLDESQEDRRQLHDKDRAQDVRMDRQDDRANRHDNRITSIETWKEEHQKNH